jgi:hypothetical protein
MERTCSTNRGIRGMHIGFWQKARKREHLEDLDMWIWMNNIKMDLSEIGWGSMDSTDSDQWWALLDTVMNLGAQQNVENL